MKVNAATAFVLSGISLYLHTLHQPSPAFLLFRRLVAALVLLLGLVTLSEDSFGWDAGIDQLLFHEPAGAALTSHPGRMAVIAATNFALLGGALLLAEARLWVAAQAMASAVAAFALLSLCGYSISHDLRAPLRAINGFSKILQEEYADRLDDEGKRLLNVVGDNAQKMGQLIDDILAFSRAGRNEIERATINMEKLVAGVWEELKPEMAGRDIHLELRGLSPAEGDATMMHQVVFNLLSNAVKFTQHNADARIEVGSETSEHETIYHVRDNGAGFDMQYAGKLFGVFLRLHGMDEFEGTGIGLSIVKRIIAKHGGRVWAEGKVDGGATIYFALPI